MREIKFRAWDKNENAMLEDVSTWTDDFTNMINETFRYWVNPELANLELMQFTGRENIYEGDIVQDDEGDVYVVQWDNKQSKYVANLINAESEVADVFDLNEVSCIVIGNIYENPELVENTNGDEGRSGRGQVGTRTE